MRALERVLPSTLPMAASNLGPRESELLRKVGVGLSEEEWRRYRELKSRSDDEILTPAEHQELIATCDRIERANAQRMSHLIELSALRNVSLETLMDQLGLGNGREAGGQERE